MVASRGVFAKWVWLAFLVLGDECRCREEVARGGDRERRVSAGSGSRALKEGGSER